MYIIFPSGFLLESDRLYSIAYLFWLPLLPPIVPCADANSM